MHTGGKPYKSSECEKGFSEHSNLTAQLRTYTVGNVGEASTRALASLFTRGLTLERSLVSALSVGRDSTPVPSLAFTGVSIQGRAYTSVCSVGKASTIASTSVPTRKPTLENSLTSALSERKVSLRMPHSSAIRKYTQEIYHRKRCAECVGNWTPQFPKSTCVSQSFLLLREFY